MRSIFRSELAFLLIRVAAVSLLFYLLMLAGTPLLPCLVAQFAIAILYFHWLFGRRVNSERVRPMIDYVYLGVGFIGLMSTGFDFANKQAAEQDHDRIKQLDMVSGEVLDGSNSLLADLCSPVTDPELCTRLHLAVALAYPVRAFATQTASGLALRPPMMQAKINEVYHWLLEYATGHVKSLDRSNYDALITLAGDINLMGFGLDRYTMDGGVHLGNERGLFNMKFFGFALLTTAVALRITRVTIEMQGWDKRANLANAPSKKAS